MSRISPTPRAVLFDMDGVLIESKEAWYHVTVDTALVLGAAEVTREAFDAGWGQGVADDIERFFPGHTEEEVSETYTRLFARHIDNVRYDADAVRVLDALRAAGIATAVVTNSPVALARTVLSAGRLWPDTMVGADQVAVPKPAPDILYRACALLAMEAQDVVMVGDSLYDRDAAAAAGVRFIGLRTSGERTVMGLADVLDLVLPG